MIKLILSLSVTVGLDLAADSRAFRLARSRASSRLAISLIGLPPYGGRQNPHSERRRGGPRAQNRMLHLSVVRRLLSPVLPKLNGYPHNHCLALNRPHRSRNRSGESRVEMRPLCKATRIPTIDCVGSPGWNIPVAAKEAETLVAERVLGQIFSTRREPVELVRSSVALELFYLPHA